MANNKFRGTENVEIVWHGQWSDPELRYNGMLFNYWNIENALWDMFEEENPDLDVSGEWADDAILVDAMFDKFVQENCVNYLKDVIYSMAPTFFEMMPDTNRIMEEVVVKEKLELSVLEYLAEKGRRDVLDAIYKYAEHPYEYELMVFGAWDAWLDCKEWYEIKDEDAEVFDDTGLDMTIVVWK